MQEHIIKSITQFREVINEMKLPNYRYFRGQPADYALIPSLGRIYKGRLFFEAEHLLFDKFREEYKRGYDDPKNRNPKEFPKSYEKLNPWEWATIAQHHRLPTRLLDWSQNYSKGLYFSVYNRTPKEEQSDGVIYIFQDKTAISHRSDTPFYTHGTEENRVMNVRPYIPNLDIPRIKAQEGALTSQPNPMDDLTTQINKEAGHNLIKLIVQRAYKNTIREELKTSNITEAILFPDMDGICRHVSFEILGRFA
jgi:hypothetical protein